MRIKVSPLVLVACASLWACAAPIVRVAQPDLRPVPPAIERLVDLGGLPLPATGPLSQDESDGVLTPGEWVAVLGQGLDAGDRSRVTIDGAAVDIKGHLQGGSLLVQVPRHLAPRQAHQLAVSTPAGTATVPLVVQSYVVVGETTGKTVHFLPMQPDAKTVLSKPAADVDLTHASLHTLSPSGAWLFIVEDLQRPGQGTSLLSEIAVVHMGAHKHPRLLGKFPVETAAPPSSVAMLDESTLLVLSEGDLAICQVTGAQGRQVGRVALPRPSGKVAYVDVETLAGRWAVVLETYGNTATLVDLSDPQRPRVASTLDAAKVKGVPWSIDLVPDLDDSLSLWLLQGPNLRISGEKLRGYASAVEAKTKATLGLKSAKPAPAAQPEPSPEPNGRLLHIRVTGDRLDIAGERPLPTDLFPFFVVAKPKGELLVSGVTSNVFGFASLPRSLDGVKMAIDVLSSSLQFGRIVRLRADGSAEQMVKGSAIYLNLDTLSNGTLVYSVIRPGVSVLPPSLKVEWGVESAGSSDTDEDYRRLVDLEWTAIIPPYTLGMLSVQ